MKKIFLLGWKDLTLAFRDRAALIMMLLAPFALTLGMGLVTGSLSGGSSGISSIPVALVNQDQGELGSELVNLFQSADLADLVLPTLTSDPSSARQQVDDDQIAAFILIPAGFSASLMPDPVSGKTGAAAEIELYINPNRPTSSGIIQSIVQQFVNRVEAGSIGVQVAVSRLLQSGLIAPPDAARLGSQLGSDYAQNSQAEPPVRINSVEQGEAPVEFNLLAYMAPGMALMFLMFTVSHGGRSLLVEKTQGTLPRLLVAPLSGGQVLLGKMFGVFLTGLAQVLILILASTLLFQLKWGDPLAVLLLVIAAVIGAVGWGTLLTALVSTPSQAASYGTAVMLIFGILGGSFFDVQQLPRFFNVINKITPNAWGIDGFAELASGGGLTEILPNIGALLVMGAVLFGISMFLFNRRGVIQR